MSQLYNLTVQNLLAPVANITTLSGGTATFTSISSSGGTGALNTATANVTYLNAQQANIQTLVGQSATFTTISSTGNTGTLTAAIGNLTLLNAQAANVTGPMSVLGNVGILTTSPIYPLDVAGSSRIQGNLGVQTVPSYPLDVSGTVRAAANTSSGRATGFRLENLGSSAGGATFDMASQFSGLAQANKIAGQLYGEPDSATGGRVVITTASPSGVLTGAINVNAYQQVGINTSSPAFPLDVGGSSRIQGALTLTGNLVGPSANLTSLSTQQANVAVLNAGASTSVTYALTLAATVGAYTQICYLTDPQNAATYMIRLTLVQSRGSNATFKSYNLAMTFRYLPGTWMRVIPEYNMGPDNSNDFALDVTSSGSTVTVRAVRLSVGNNPNTGLTAFVNVTSDTGYPITLTYDGTTGTGATNSGLYTGSPIGVNLGNVGILTATPAFPLDVAGAARVQGTLTASAANISTFNGVNPYIVTNQLTLQGTAPGFYIGNAFSTGQSGFFTFNNVGPPSGASTLGLGVYGQSPNGGLSINASGNVGVNYSAPAYPFDVGGAARISGQVLLGGNVGILTATPAYPLDVAGSSRIQGPLLLTGNVTAPGATLTNLAVQQANVANITGNSATYSYVTATSLSTPSNVWITNADPGDMIGKAYGTAGDRYGMGQYTNGTMRLYTSSAWAPATVNLSLASTDGAAGNSTLWSDLLTASQSSISFKRPATATSNLAVAGTLTASNVGILTTTPAYPLDVAGNARVQGTLLNGASAATPYTFNLAANVGSYTQICNFSDPQTTSTYMIRVVLVQARTSNALLKSYNIPVTAANFTGSFVRCIPEYSQGPSAGNDFALDVYQYSPNGSVYLRAVRTGSGTTTVTGMTAYVSVVYDAGYPITFSYDGTTGSGVSNVSLYTPSPIGVTQGNVGILTLAPAFPLDVAGAARITGNVTLANASVTTLAVLGNSTYAGPVTVGNANTLPVFGMLNPVGNGGIYFEPGNLTGGGGVGWNMINFNGFYNNGEVILNPARTRWRIGADQRGSVERFILDQVANTGSSNQYLTCTAGNLGILTSTPAYPLDVTGATRVQGNLLAQSATLSGTLITAGANLSSVNPYVNVVGGGDLIGLRYTQTADRYGLAVNNAVTRVITSGVTSTAQVALSLASTDGLTSTATAFTDLLYAGNTAVGVTRPFTAPSANVQGGLTVAGDIVLYGNLRQVAFANSSGGGLPNYSFGNISAANASVTGTLIAGGPLIATAAYTWMYKTTSSSSSTTGAAQIPTSSSMFTFQSAASPYTTDIMFTTDTTNANTGVKQASLLMPFTGIWSISWAVRYQNYVTGSGGENDIFICPLVASTYGESGQNSNGTRLGWTSTSAYNVVAMHTGYMKQGETYGLGAYSSAANSILSGLYFLSITLVQRTV